jgi:hypothetical protein
MEIDAAFARIPLLLTQPATPTTPPRDWTIDERSDRLFREFSRRDVAKPTTTTTAGGSTSPRSNSLRANRQRHPLLPKRKSYSPSSSHTGTPAQASIEEEEEEHTSTTTCNKNNNNMDASSSLNTSPTPDYFVCSTKEELLNQINMRSQSPELRHVPIIKLPDQESDEV